MDNLEYKEFLKKFMPKEHRTKNFIISFIVGGLIGLSAQVIVKILMSFLNISLVNAGTITGLIIVFIGSLFTVLGFFDNWVTKLKCGLIIPTTGFAHSVTSSALDYKKDGLITGLGSNFFKLAGSVILYGIISSFILVLGRVIIGV